MVLEPDVAQTIAITLHELATNAAKYGALAVPDGQVELKWSHDADGRLQLRWTDRADRKCKNRRTRDLAGGLLNK